MSSINYKVGDVVKVKEDLVVNEVYGGQSFTESMSQCDKVTISQVYGDKYYVDEITYVYTDEMLDELVERRYTEDDIKVGTRLKCISTHGNWWIVEKIYTVSDDLEIYDEDGDARTVECILGYLNSTDTDYITFVLCEEDVDNSEVIDINSPDYYTEGIETKDYIRSHNLNFNRGSAVKYATRAGKKHPEKEIEDLQKAINFLQFEIDYLLENDETLK